MFRLIESAGSKFEGKYGLLNHTQTELLAMRTLDLKFNHFSTKRKIVNYIDTPSDASKLHLAAQGCVLADFAILVVDASEPIPQEIKERLIAAQTMGVRDLIILVNKADRMAFEKQLIGQVMDVVRQLAQKVGFST